MKKSKLIFLIIFTLIFSAMCSVNASEFFAKDIAWSLEFEDSFGGADLYTYDEFRLKLNNGTMEAAYEDTKPYMNLDTIDPGIPVENIEYLAIRIASANDMMLKFYFITDKAANWSEDRAFYLKPSGGSVMNEYIINTTGIDNWTDKITRLRMDFLGADGTPATNTLSLDYIRIFGRDGSSAQKTESGIRYDFSKNSKLDGWKFNSGDLDKSIGDGKISAAGDGEKTLETCGNLNIAANEYGNISVKMQNGTANDKARLYFKNKAGDAYTNYFEFDVVPNDNVIRTYKISTGKNASWTKGISGLKFDFGSMPGSISVDDIYLRRHPYKTVIDDDFITVSGSVSALCTVGIQIANDEEDINAATVSGNYSDAVIYLDETKSGADGNFSFKCATPKSEQPQKFAIILAADDELYYSSAFYADSGYADRTVENFNAAVNSNDTSLAGKIITDAYDYLGIDALGCAEYSACYENSELLGEQLVRLGKAGGIDELKSIISKAAVFVSLMSCEKDVLAALAEKYDSVTCLSGETAYDIYKTLAESEKAEILYVSRENAESLEDLRKTFDEKTVLYGIKFTMGTDALKKIIHDNKDILGIDISKEEKVKNPERLYAMLAGRLYGSFEQVKNAYNDAANACAETQSSAEKNYFGGGGGGGGASSSKVTPNAVPLQAPKDVVIFNDIAGCAWAKESIEALYKKGIAAGREKGKFMPEDNVTRAEFIKMLISALELTESTNAPFGDVAENAWYKSYIDKAYAAGIALGNSDGSFCPEKNISRQDMAVLIYRSAADYFDDAANASFTDSANIAPYADGAVSALSDAGIINGMEDGSFMPQSFATRAQTAVIVNRLLSLVGRI